MKDVAERAFMGVRTIGRAGVLSIQTIRLRRKSPTGVERGIKND